LDESNKKLQLSRGTTRKSNESIKITMAKNNMGVQKFKGHYKQTISLKKSGYTDNDVMLHAYSIWKEDEGSNFGSEHAWRLMKY